MNYTDASVGGTNLPVADISGVEIINVRNVGQGTAATFETATVTFTNLGAGETATVGAATSGAALTAAAQVAFFSNAANVPAGYEVTATTANSVTYRATAAGVTGDVTVSGSAPASAPTVAIVQGVAAGAVAVNTFSAANLVGATTFNTDKSIGGVTITDLAAGQTLGMIGNGATTVGALTATYANTVTSTTLNLSSGLQTDTAANGQLIGAGNVTINGNAIATANINSTANANAVGAITFGGNAITALNIKADSNFGLTAANAISGFSGTQESTVTVTGAGAVRVNTLDAALDVYNASAATGAQTLTLGANTQKVTTGSGNDVITTGGIVLGTGSVDAGAGTADRLVITASADISAVTGPKYSNFEQVRLLENGAGITLNMDHLAAKNTIDTIQLHNTANAATVTNVTAAQAEKIQVTNAAVGAITIAVKGASNAGQIDTVKIAATTTTAAGAAQNIDFATNALVLASVEKLEITGNGTSATNTGTINFTTTDSTSLDSIKLSNAGNGNTVTIAAGHTATNLVVDASGSTGNTTVNAAAYNTTTGAQVIGGKGNDTITVSARSDVIDLTAGGRDIVIAQAGAGDVTATSTTAAPDVVKGFGLVTTAINDTTGIAATFQNAGVTTGGANADILNLADGAAANVTRLAATTSPVDVAAASGNAASADIKASVDARGLLTLSGADAALVDSLAEWIAIADSVTGNAALDADDGKSVAFRFGTDSYIFTEIDAAAVANDGLVKLEGVSITGIALVGQAGTALVGEALIA